MAAYQVTYQLRVVQNGRVINRKHIGGLGKADAAVIKAQAGQLFVIADTLGIQNAPQIKTKRVGKNLHLALENGTPDIPDLIVEGYFNFSDVSLVGATSDGRFLPYDFSALDTAPADPVSAPSSAATRSTEPEGVAAAQTKSPVVTSSIADPDGMPGLQKGALAGLGLLALGGVGGGGGGAAGALSADALIAKVKAYADDGSQAAPTVDDYKNIGVTGVTDRNIEAVNSAVDASAGGDVDSKAKLQNLIDAYNKILGEANGLAADATPGVNPTVQDYQSIGVKLGNIATQTSGLALLNEVVGGQTSTGVDTVAELNALAAVVNKVMLLADGGSASLTVEELALIGIATTGSGAVNSTNLPAIVNAIKLAGGQAAVDSLAELGGLVTGIATLSNYAADGTQATPTLSTYAGLGVTGVTSVNLTAMNSAIDALSPAQVDSKAEVQAVVDAYTKILAEANGSAVDATPSSNPSIADYALIGANIDLAKTNPAALNLLNEVVGNSATTAVDTIAEINALAVAVGKVIQVANGQTSSLSFDDLMLLGLPSVGAGALTPANFPAVLAAIANSGGQNSVDTFRELSGLTGAVATIFNYANDSTQPPPTLANYQALGITGITASNVDAINTAIDANTSAGVDTKAKVQSVVDAYNFILDEANGAASDQTPGLNPTVAQYKLIGANIGAAATDTENLALLNNSIAGLQATAVDTVAEINALAQAANAVMSGAAGGAGPSLEQLKLLGVAGLTNITPEQLQAIQAAIAATNDDGTQVDSIAELNALVAKTVATVVSSTASQIIKNYADDNTSAAPTVTDYEDAGVTGVTSGNLSSINSAVDALASSNVDSKAKVQAVVNAYVKILAEANGSAADLTPGSNPSAADYALIGANIDLAKSNPAALSLLNDVIGNLTTSAVDSVGEINAIAAVVGKVMQVANGQVSSLSLEDLALLGLPTVGVAAITPTNLSAVVAAIASAGGENNVDTWKELSGLTNAVVTIFNYANDATQVAPTLANYQALGITGISASNIEAVNSAIDANTSAGVDTKAKVQAVVDAYNFILNEANGAASDQTPGLNPTVAQYNLIGANIGAAATDTENLALLNNSIAGLQTTAVDTVAEINALAQAANAVMSCAAGGAAPSLAQLKLLGVTGLTDITAEELLAIQTAIAATSDDGTQVDSMAELNALVGKTLATVAASQVLKNYADNNTAATPSLTDYNDIGVTGVTSGNLSSINSAVDALVSSNVDTTAEVQTLVNAYLKILAEANGSAADATPGVNPSAQDYAAIGASIGLAQSGVAGGTDVASNSLSLLDDAVGGLTSTSVNTVSKINALGAIIDKVMALAQLPTGSAIPVTAVSMSELASLGLNVSLVNTAGETNAIWQAIINTADTGSGVATIAALQAIINANAS